jgi:CDP-glucose 4,6-dehydratase
MNAAFWQGKRVLLTGHTGFKGGWLSLWLQSMGAEVVGYALTPPISNNAYLKSPISRCCPSIEKIKALDWKPTVNLQDGFRRTIQSYL